MPKPTSPILDEMRLDGSPKAEAVDRWWAEAMQLEVRTGAPGMAKGYVMDLLVRGILSPTDPEFTALLQLFKSRGY